MASVRDGVEAARGRADSAPAAGALAGRPAHLGAAGITCWRAWGSGSLFRRPCERWTLGGVPAASPALQAQRRQSPARLMMVAFHRGSSVKARWQSAAVCCVLGGQKTEGCVVCAAPSLFEHHLVVGALVPSSPIAHIAACTRSAHHPPPMALRAAARALAAQLPAAIGPSSSLVACSGPAGAAAAAAGGRAAWQRLPAASRPFSAAGGEAGER